LSSHFLGEEEVEPEVDLSHFLERQRLSEVPEVSSLAPHPLDEGEVDESLAHISSRPNVPSQFKKGRVQTIVWDQELDEIAREKAAAEATRGMFGSVSWNNLLASTIIDGVIELKTRFQEKTNKMRAKPIPGAGRTRGAGLC
jgi:hypothetical protein